MSSDSPFVPQHVERTGTVKVALAPARTIELFTPRGEELWVPGWEPAYLHPRDGRTVDGGVFTTAADDAATYWMVTRWEPGNGRAAYARITPALHAADVDIRCEGDADETIVAVRYRLTALTAAGNTALGEWTDEWFAGYLRTWERLLADHLQSKGGN